MSMWLMAFSPFAGLQILPAWQQYFHNPNGKILGLISAAQVIGSIVVSVETHGDTDTEESLPGSSNNSVYIG